MYFFLQNVFLFTERIPFKEGIPFIEYVYKGTYQYSCILNIFWIQNYIHRDADTPSMIQTHIFNGCKGTINF